MLGGSIAALGLGTGAASSTAKPYTLQVDGLDVLKEAGAAGALFGVDPRSILLRERFGEVAQLSFTIDDPAEELTIRRRANVYLADHRGKKTQAGGYVSNDLFRGTVQTSRKIPDGLGWRWQITALGLDNLLDRRRPGPGTIPAGILRRSALQLLISTLDPRVSALANDLSATHALDDPVVLGSVPNLIHDSFADDSVGDALIAEAIPMTGKTYRQVAQAIIDPAVLTSYYQEGGSALAPEWVFRIDPQGRFTWRHSVRWTPLLDVREGSGTPAGQPAPIDIEPSEDSGRLVHRVYVQGATDAVSGWVASGLADTDGDEAYDEFLEAPDVNSTTARDAVGRAYLGSRKLTPRWKVTLEDTHDRLFETPASAAMDLQIGGWNVGNRASTITSDSGLFTQAPYRLLWEVTRTWPGANDVRLEMIFGAPARDVSAAVVSRLSQLRDESRSGSRILGTLKHARIRTKPAPPADVDVESPNDGQLALDTTAAGGLYARINGVWVPIGAPTSFQTYTPTIAGDGGATYSTRTGFYWRAGKVVTICIYLVVSTAGAGASAVTIETPTAPDRTTRQVIPGYTSGLGAAGAASLVAFTGGAGVVWDRIQFPGNAATDDDTAMTGAGMLNTGVLVFQGWYREA